jgi:hypothetical protein
MMKSTLQPELLLHFDDCTTLSFTNFQRDACVFEIGPFIENKLEITIPTYFTFSDIKNQLPIMIKKEDPNIKFICLSFDVEGKQMIDESTIVSKVCQENQRIVVHANCSTEGQCLIL